MNTTPAARDLFDLVKTAAKGAVSATFPPFTKHDLMSQELKGEFYNQDLRRRRAV